MVSLADSLRVEFTDDEVSYIVDHAAALGLLMKECCLSKFNLLPITLLPCVFPRSAIGMVTEAQMPINIMVDRIARNIPWLHALLEPIAATDEFTAKLLAISKTIHAEGLRQTSFLGILRSDYMLDSALGKPLQVEINTIASSFGVLSTKLSELHRIVLETFSDKFTVPRSTDDMASVTVFQSLIDAMESAVSAYGGGAAAKSVLLVSDETERNLFDQIPLSLELKRQQ